MSKTITNIPDKSIRICADRGGTFCDLHVSYPNPSDPSRRSEHIIKLLSQDPGNYRDAPTEGIRRILSQLTGEEIPRGKKLPTNKIDFIRLSTTVATNALLERKGCKHALLITKGFKDALVIGNQSRPNIFALNIKRPSVLYDKVVEVDERVTIEGYTSDPNAVENSVVFDDNGNVMRGYKGKTPSKDVKIVKGLSGEAIRIIREPDEEKLTKDLTSLHEQGYTSVAVALMHSYTYPAHELLIGSIARSIGFPHISLSSQLLSMIKFVPRGMSATADAYLTPVLFDYLDGFFKGFENEGKDMNVEFMSSDGGLVPVQKFSGLKSILSGPAGGVVAVARTSWDADDGRAIIGIDIGGTSTDVHRYSGRFETTYETTTAGITIQSPQMDINTVAAGGGSCLTFSQGLVRAGPESAGAEPGPACYRKGGPLAVTDANLLLGRLIPDYFPKIFGKSEDQPLDAEASRKRFEALAKEMGDSRDLDEIVYGFIKVANESMCRPIRALTEARGYATSQHILATFGGAGGQHAVEIARILGISVILIHRYSSILSAYGLALADRAHEVLEPSSEMYPSDGSGQEEITKRLEGRLDDLEKQVREELARQGFDDAKDEGKVEIERQLNMRFEGTDTALMILQSGEGASGSKWVDEFKKTYKDEFGFLLEDVGVCVDDVKVRGMGKTHTSLGPSVHELLRGTSLHPVTETKIDSRHSVYFPPPLGRVPDTPVYLLDNLEEGDVVRGPGVIIDDTQTIVVDGSAEAVVVGRFVVLRLDP